MKKSGVKEAGAKEKSSWDILDKSAQELDLYNQELDLEKIRHEQSLRSECLDKVWSEFRWEQTNIGMGTSISDVIVATEKLYNYISTGATD